MIAQRTFQIKSGDGTTPLAISIFSPREVEADHWACDYEIDWPEGKRRFAGHGIDSVQALVIALQMIGTYHRAGRLIYPGLPGGFGFPVAGNVRDLLEGADRENF
ncbi:MAG: hypothetical protein JWM36_1686 [Hyphomicrobiales bacterium]|nr:hypothetical protein [Hyphomicrobiales bacterium]